jgi:hypothetical protein
LLLSDEEEEADRVGAERDSPRDAEVPPAASERVDAEAATAVVPARVCVDGAGCIPSFSRVELSLLSYERNVFCGDVRTGK